MYKVYLTKFIRKWDKHASVIKESRTVTPSAEAARVAFVELLKRKDLLGQPVQVVLSLNKKLLMLHKFESQEGDPFFIKPTDTIKLHVDEHRD